MYQIILNAETNMINFLSWSVESKRAGHKERIPLYQQVTSCVSWGSHLNQVIYQIPAAYSICGNHLTSGGESEIIQLCNGTEQDVWIAGGRERERGRERWLEREGERFFSVHIVVSLSPAILMLAGLLQSR